MPPRHCWDSSCFLLISLGSPRSSTTLICTNTLSGTLINHVGKSGDEGEESASKQSQKVAKNVYKNVYKIPDIPIYRLIIIPTSYRLSSLDNKLPLTCAYTIDRDRLTLIVQWQQPWLVLKWSIWNFFRAGKICPFILEPLSTAHQTSLFFTLSFQGYDVNGFRPVLGRCGSTLVPKPYPKPNWHGVCRCCVKCIYKTWSISPFTTH